MKISPIINNCLTYDQLQAYSLMKNDSAERTQIYKHLSACELCTYAAKGFVYTPFGHSDIIDIHNQIDIRTNTANQSWASFGYAFIAFVSILLIFGFYSLADSFSKNVIKTTSVEKIGKLIIPLSKSEETIPVFEYKVVGKIPKQRKMIGNNLFKKTICSPEPIKSITACLIKPPEEKPDYILQPCYNSDVVYIYNLKITDYERLYFKQAGKFSFGRHTPSFKENEETMDNQFGADSEEIIVAEKVLKKGLIYLNKEKYNKSIAEFQILIDNNPNDINALFYSAFAFYQIDKYNLAIKNFNAVLSHANNVFHPEAKWNLALVYLKTGEEQTAKQLLLEIVNEKGFYAKKAEVRLATFK